MTFARTDEQRQLADMLDAHLARGGVDWASAVEDSGVASLGIAEDAGGLGTDLRDAAVVAAAFGRANAGLDWAKHWVTNRHGATNEDARDALAILHSAEMVGLCATLLADTAAFLKERRQFGVPIASFQALRHRMADMAMALALAEAAVGAAVDTPEDARAVAAARVLAEDAARVVGEGAVQLHGAMGLTAELRVGGYFRRLRVLMQGDGTARRMLKRMAA
ncbi:acyl-CoA dehydrogenase family protein [Sphingomonas adhaesiva]|uniref:acyl-CoA dehydrogenase family protein n=1 Tax=Sphingomonas adhaesiva TaxID=28212 RepID=UPI002FFD04AF